MIKDRMFKINEKLVYKLMQRIAENIDEPKRLINAELDIQYNNGINTSGRIVDDLFSISYFFNGNDGLGRNADNGLFILNTPLVYKDAGVEFQEDIYWFLNMEYGFDLFEWGNQYGFCFEESVILFNICHEMGHLKHFIEEHNECGYYKSYEEDKDKEEELKYLRNEEEIFIRYRRMLCEVKADKYGIEFLKEYGEFMKNLVNKGMLTECITEEEVSDIVFNHMTEGLENIF